MLGWVVGGLLGLLFRLGSLLYLAATAILCLDVIIVHRSALLGVCAAGALSPGHKTDKHISSAATCIHVCTCIHVYTCRL